LGREAKRKGRDFPLSLIEGLLNVPLGGLPAPAATATPAAPSKFVDGFPRLRPPESLHFANGFLGFGLAHGTILHFEGSSGNQPGTSRPTLRLPWPSHEKCRLAGKSGHEFERIVAVPRRQTGAADRPPV
jgi:hypothetical protein